MDAEETKALMETPPEIVYISYKNFLLSTASRLTYFESVAHVPVE